MSKPRALAGAFTATLVVAAGCSGQGNVFSLEPGTCFDDAGTADGTDAGEELVSDVDVVDCAGPHFNEVFATFDIDRDEYPGPAETLTLADDGCLERFGAFVGTDYATSELVLLYFVPTEQGWSNGDREVICYLFAGSLERIQGSARGSRR